MTEDDCWGHGNGSRVSTAPVHGGFSKLRFHPNREFAVKAQVNINPESFNSFNNKRNKRLYQRPQWRYVPTVCPLCSLLSAERHSFFNLTKKGRFVFDIQRLKSTLRAHASFAKTDGRDLPPLRKNRLM